MASVHIEMIQWFEKTFHFLNHSLNWAIGLDLVQPSE